MSTVLDDVASVLASGGFGTPAVSLFKGGIPIDPARNILVQDEVVGLEVVPGPPDALSHEGRSYTQPMVKVSRRGAAYGFEAAYAAALAMQTLLGGLRNATIGSHFYLWMQAMQSPWREQIDDFQRPVLVFTVLCAMRDA